jgi:PKD repeat protein
VGSYSVTVSDGNCTSSTIVSISENGAPTVWISASNTIICVGETIQLSASGADSYSWSPATYLSSTTGDIVDATPLTNITYTVQGTTAGCSDSQTISIIVNSLPIAGFNTVDNGSGNIDFIDLSQNGTSWIWNFGDGGTDNVQNPNYTYGVDGTYNVSQIVQNTCGSDTAYQTIIIMNTPVATLSVSQLEVYPNPNNGHFNLKYTSGDRGGFVIEVINVIGEVVFTKEYSKTSATIVVPVDFEPLAKGVYQIRLNSSNDEINTRLIIDRY